jgi:PAS domain S-box-containing protein
LDEHILATIKSIINYSDIPHITKNIIALTNFLYMQENIGLLRAKGSVIVIEKNPTISEIIDYASINTLINEYEKMFLSITNASITQNYIKLKNSNDYKRYLQFNKLILSRKLQDLTAIVWFDTLTNIINNFNQITTLIKFNTENVIDKKLQDFKYTFALVSNLTILSLFAFILMIIAFLKLSRDEQKLREVADKYIISSQTDTKGRIIDVSQAFCDISGFSKDELIGKPHNIVRHPDMPKEVFKEMWSKIKQGKPWSGKVKNLKKDGEYYWVYAHIEPLYNTKGEIESYISIRLDITEIEQLAQQVKEEELKNKKTQELMQQQSRLAQMGEMISMIAHQWRQPLSAITATSGTLELKAKMQKITPQEVEKSAQKIRDFSLHLSSTIDDFRNFFKTKKEKIKTNFEKIIISVQSIIYSSLTHNNISLVIEKKSVSDIYTFEGELKQVILNLIKNAEDALIENKIQDPKIYVTIDGTKLHVHDNAGGIPDDIIDKIFNPYFSTKVNKDGTGLGLYMSKTIVEEHCKGKLSVKNENGGAKFTIELSEES